MRQSSWSLRLAGVLATAVAMASLAGAASASPGDGNVGTGHENARANKVGPLVNQCLNFGSGTARYCPAGIARFEARTDTFHVCDPAPDGHSVVVRWSYRRDGRTVRGVAVNSRGTRMGNWGGGCTQTRVRGLPRNRKISFRVWLADNARRGGRPMTFVPGSGGPASESANAF